MDLSWQQAVTDWFPQRKDILCTQTQGNTEASCDEKSLKRLVDRQITIYSPGQTSTKCTQRIEWEIGHIRCCVGYSCQRLWLIPTLIPHFDWDQSLPLTHGRQTEHIWSHLIRVIPSLSSSLTWRGTHTHSNVIKADRSEVWLHDVSLKVITILTSLDAFKTYLFNW